MTLTQLYEAILPKFPTYSRKDLKTAVKVLAQAFQYQDPSHCPVETCHRPLPDLYRVVERHLTEQGKKVHTIKNTKNNLSRMIRLAIQAGLWPSIQPNAPLHPQFGTRLGHPRPGGERAATDGSYLTLHNWPPPLKQAFAAFEHWATAPLIAGRDAHWRKRPATIKSYRRHFESYFGYLYHQRGIRRPAFDQLFNIALIQDYIYWHVNDRFKQPTAFIRGFLKNLLALTRQYRPLPELQAQLTLLDRQLTKPNSHYNKVDAWVPLDTLESIGRELWPTRVPQALRGNGRLTARTAGLSLVFRLWTFIPYRARNIYEMQLGENLHQDEKGQWRITFAGDQLKIRRKKGQTNVYDLPFPPALVPTLETYLTTWRPILTRKTAHRFPHVFLNRLGRPYDVVTLNRATNEIVHRYTGKHWHPHIVRTVWATEWIRDKNPGDFYGAAFMLNDTLETVIKKYAHLLGDGIAEKVYNRLSYR